MKQLILIALLAVSGWGAQRSVYYNSKNTVNGDGSIGSPYKTLALGNTTVTNYISAGDTVTCYLRDSSAFYEAWTIPSGGASNPLTITSYGDLGKDPIISNGAIATPWATVSYAPENTYGHKWTQTVGKVWFNDTLLNSASSIAELQDRQWYYDGDKDTLFLRSVRGNPDLTGDKVIRTSATQTILLSGCSNIYFNNIDIRHASTFAIRVATTASNLRFTNCTFNEYVTFLSLTATSAVFDGCVFSNATGPAAPIIIGGTSAITFRNCHIKNSIYGAVSLTGGRTNFYNCNIDGIKNTVISSTSTDSTFIKNTIIHGLVPGGKAVLSATKAPIMVAKSCILKSGYSGYAWYSGNVEFTDIIRDEPKIVKTAREGFYSISEDDLIGIGDFSKTARYMMGINSNWSASFALSEPYNATTNQANLIKEMADNGFEITSHSMSHTYYYDGMGTIILRYTGTAPKCTVIVDTVNWQLRTLTGGTDDLTIPIGYDKTKNVAWITGRITQNTNYTCTKTYGANDKCLTYTFLGDTLWDIKAASDSVMLDTARFFNYEIDTSKVYVENIIDRSCLSFTYPGNMTDTTGAKIRRIRDGGYICARRTTPTPITLAGNYPLFEIPLNDAADPKCIMRLDKDANSALNSTNFTGTNITYNTTIQKEYNGCAVLNGSAYLYRNDATFTYNTGDYVIGIWVRPTTLNAVNTVFFTGTDNDNFLTVYIDGSGAVHYVQMRAGSPVVSLSSSNGVIPVDQWTRLAFRQTVDSVSVFTGTDIPATNRIIYSATVDTPDVYNGVTYLGAGWDFSASQPVTHFTGYFDKIDIGFNIWFNTLCQADMYAMQGCLYASLTHGDYLGPRDLQKTMIDAYSTYTGRLNLTGYGFAMEDIRANGTFSADSLTISWVQTDSADYRLRSDSKLCNAGDTSVLSGIPNLVNLSGDTLTDASGVLKVSSVNIGAYGTLNLDAPPTITAQPQSDSIALGSDVVLSVTATGSTPMAYVWQYWSGSWQDSGEVKYINSFTVNDIDTISTYRVIVSNPFGADTSDSAIITPVPPPVVTVQPVDQYTVIGDTAEFTIEATGTGTLSYQWQNNYEGWSDIVLDTLSIKQVPDVTSGVDNISYRCIVSDAYGADTSDSATLYVGTAPEITVQSVSDSVSVGADAVFTLTATGTDPITVNWQQLLEDWQSVGTGDSLTVVAPDSGQFVYRSVIVSPWGADTSDTVFLTAYYCYIDSIRPVSGRVTDSTVVYGLFGDSWSDTDSLRFNSVNIPLASATRDSLVIDTLPAWVPRGYYSQYLIKNGIQHDTLTHGYRVKTPAITVREVQ